MHSAPHTANHVARQALSVVSFGEALCCESMHAIVYSRARLALTDTMGYTVTSGSMHLWSGGVAPKSYQAPKLQIM